MIQIYKDKSGEWRWRLMDGELIVLRSQLGHAKIYEARKDASWVHKQLGKALRRVSEKV